LDERLGPTTLIGGIVVLAGLWLVEQAGHPAPRSAEPQPAEGQPA
jgi:drug/metabolite transporter (DMT)-like permease